MNENDFIQTSSSIRESDELPADLDNELNEIMNGSIANRDTLQMNANKITPIEATPDALIEMNKETTYGAYMERLDSIEIDLKSTNSNDPNSKSLEIDDNSHYRISDDNFSSPFEDSECFFDTIESPTVQLNTHRSTTPVDDLLEEKIANESKNEEKFDPINREDIIENTTSDVSEENLTKTNYDSSEDSTHKNDVQNQNVIEEIPVEEMQELVKELNLLDKSGCSSVSGSFYVQYNLLNIFLIVSLVDSTVKVENRVEINNLIDSISQPAQTSNQIDSPNVEQNPQVEQSTLSLVAHAPIEVIDFETEWAQITENEKMLGVIAPVWMNDIESDSCMKCTAIFTFRRRRHHCRACGLIFCSNCCFLKVALAYNLTKSNPSSAYETNDSSNESGSKSRVCNICYEIINKGSLNFSVEKRIFLKQTHSSFFSSKLMI